MKEMFIFAGPNGSGKSTVVNSYIELGLCAKNFICPDNFVAAENKDKFEPYIAAMQKAEAVRYQEVALGNSFSFETVLSTHQKLAFIRYAKLQGYIVHTYYISTESPEININRVKERVLHGGHDVPREKIISRYEKSMQMMFDVAQESDFTDFFDNSTNKHFWVGAKIRDLLFVDDLKNAPNWFLNYYLSKEREKGTFINSLT
ncbi:MAG: hypothetical protein LBL98_06145 [Ruminococcus sp.]|jgi:predicted ABC-type ATPase|nr:hypothetical protein [Ruminococcus sp.]